MKNKGFTLVELLAVIVILAVVMLIAVTSVGPMMEKSRKGALGDEGVTLAKAAETDYNAEGMKGQSARFTSTSSVCFNIDVLKNDNYYEKGVDEGYKGSVLVERRKDGTYAYFGIDKENINSEYAVDYEESMDGSLGSCGGLLSEDTPEGTEYNVIQGTTVSEEKSQLSGNIHLVLAEGNRFCVNGVLHTNKYDRCDANGDGLINVDDTSIITDNVLSVKNDTNRYALDCNEDGSVDLKDLLRVKKYLEGCTQ